MIKTFKIFFYIVYPLSVCGLMIFCFLTCGGDNKPSPDKQEARQEAQEAPQPDAPRRFVLPLIPDELKTPGARAAYLAAHYWDNFDFTDTMGIHRPEITERAFADYLNILPQTGKQEAYSSIEGVLREASKESSGRMYPYFLGLFKKYLYEAASPARNDEYYIPVARYILADSLSAEADRERAAFELELLLKNRVGGPATDVSYTAADGKKGKLSGLHKEYTLLFFYNPDCHACRETTAKLASSQVVNSLLLSGRLDVLAVYPDYNLDLWKKHASEMPPGWLNGYDKGQTVFRQKLYDLRAIPALYLLDGMKHVILKDAPAQAVENYLSEQTGSAGKMKNEE